MEMPSKRYIALMVFGGFLLALLEPIILLLMGDDLGGAFWPMAKRSLDWTYFLRDNRTLVFAFFILAIPLSYLRSRSASNLEKSIFVVFTGFIIGLLGIFFLLNSLLFFDRSVLSSCSLSKARVPEPAQASYFSDLVDLGTLAYFL